MTRFLRNFWHALRQISGDDAYDRYLRHQRLAHPDEACLDRREFYLDNEHRRWNGGVQRCC